MLYNNYIDQKQYVDYEVNIYRKQLASSFDDVYVNYNNKMAHKLIHFRNWLFKEASLLLEKAAIYKEDLNLQAKVKYVNEWLKSGKGKHLFDQFIISINKSTIDEETYQKFERMIYRLQKRYTVLSQRDVEKHSEKIDAKADWLLNVPYFIKIRLIELNINEMKSTLEKDYLIQVEDFYHIEKEMGRDQKCPSFSIFSLVYRWFRRKIQ